MPKTNETKGLGAQNLGSILGRGHDSNLAFLKDHSGFDVKNDLARARRTREVFRRKKQQYLEIDWI